MRLASHACHTPPRGRLRAFLADTRAGATAIAAAAVTVMTVGASALIVDHLWLVDQRDVLKSAAEAASLAATLAIDGVVGDDPDISDDALEAALLPVAERYVLVNLAHLPSGRLERAKDTLAVTLDLDRTHHTVAVTAEADLGGTLLSRALPLLGSYAGPKTTVAEAGVESRPIPVEVVLAVDVSQTMVHTLDGRGHDPDDNRLAIVRRAAKDLVAILEPNQHDRVAVGLVLWTDQVRLDPDSAETWDDTGWSKVAAGSSQFMLDKREACFGGRRMYTGVARVPQARAEALFALPARAPFAEVLCRGQFHGSSVLMPPMLPLSNEPPVINAEVDALYNIFTGRSDSALGVLWAQRMLEPAWKRVWGGAGVHPADPATPEHAKLRKAIVLLTSNDDESKGVSRAEACDAAKSRGTEIFVIAAMPSGDIGAFGQSLRECSSENDTAYPQGTRRPGGTYIFLNNATPAALEAAFADIAHQLRTLRKVS